LELEVEINKTITYVVKYLLRVRKFFRQVASTECRVPWCKFGTPWYLGNYYR